MRTTNQSRKTQESKRSETQMTVYLEYACYFCGEVHDNASDTRDHVKRVHSHYIPPQPIGKRPEGINYVFGSTGRQESDRYACASCWFDCPKDLYILNEHTVDVHDPYFIDKEEAEEISRVRDNESYGIQNVSFTGRRRQDFSSTSVPYGSDQIDRILGNISKNARRNRPVRCGELKKMVKSIVHRISKFCSKQR